MEEKLKGEWNGESVEGGPRQMLESGSSTSVDYRNLEISLVTGQVCQVGLVGQVGQVGLVQGPGPGPG